MINTDKRKNAHGKIFFGLTLAIAFTIPVYGRLIPLLIALLFLNWLIEGNYLKTIRLISRERERLAMFSFSSLYFLYLLGLSYTSNYAYAWDDLMLKFSILLFPLIFATAGSPVFTAAQTGTILRVFAAGCIAGSMVLLGQAFYFSVFMHQADAFYYSNLSWSFHPSYYALYLTFALSNILFFYLIGGQVNGARNRAMHILILLFFTLMVVLLSSKAGLVIWVLVICFYTFLLCFRYRRWLAGLMFLSVAMGTFFLFLQTFPVAVSRVSQARQDVASKDSVEQTARSTNERKLIWKSSEKVIMQNFIFGVGTGDTRDALLKQYREDNILTLLKHYLNAHNQYLQTFIALGVIGLLCLILTILVPAVMAFRQGSYIYFCFLLVVGVSLFVESMFETQAGVVFFAFFNMVLFASRNDSRMRHATQR
ncbi:MAG: O-antigen ligase family protein [Bacteroidota bacterium]